jgi:hypothetical protein
MALLMAGGNAGPEPIAVRIFYCSRHLPTARAGRHATSGPNAFQPKLRIKARCPRSLPRGSMTNNATFFASGMCPDFPSTFPVFRLIRWTRVQNKALDRLICVVSLVETTS